MRSSVLGPIQAVGRAAVSAVASVGKAGYLALGALRALRKVEIWGPHLLGQMAKIGVDSLPIALFIADWCGLEPADGL